VRSVKADLGDVRPIGTGTGRQALVSVPLDGVRPGDYVARARVRARGETIAEILRQVEVVDGTPPAEAPPAPAARVTPRMILGGELSRRFVTATAKSVAEPALKAAAAQAEGGHWESVSTQLERVPAAATKGADYLVLLGLAQFAAEQYDPAAASLQSAFTLSPTSAPTAFLLGWVHSNAGRPQEALTAWRNAIRLDATMTSAYLALAETYLQLSHPELAVQVLKEGLKAQPTSLELQNKLAVVERR
jgi:tetratricopeptide (TPR) repeat protein